ncbi:MAG: hypothetical protein GXO22_01000 [Aquificae bacterium]|nr:hypothetical protein [Aquificota bacterium]
MKKLLFLGILTSAFVFSSGFDCNLDDSNNDNGTDTVEEEVQSSYLFYKTDLNQYFVVDPNNPLPVQVEENITDNSLQLIAGGDFEDEKIKNIQNQYVVYIKNGKIYKIDLSINSDLAPERVSSEDDVDFVCESKGFTDFLLNRKSAYLYKVADNLSDCEDDYDWYYVYLDMSLDDNPVKIGEKDIIMPLYDRDSGTIVGWLIRDGDNLRYCDEEFDDCDKVKYLEDNLDEDYLPNIKYLGSFTYVEEGNEGGLFNKDLFVVKDRLYLFIYNINQTEEAVFFEIPSYQFRYDYENIVHHQEGNTIYFTDGGRIIKVDIKEIEDDKVIEIVAEVGNARIKDFVITDNRIVFVASIENPDLGDIDALYSVKKDGEDLKTLIPILGDRIRTIDIVTASSDKVYYNVKETLLINNEQRTIAGYLKDDDIATIKEFEYAYWGGGTYLKDVEVFKQPRLYRILKIEQCVHGDDCANNGAIFSFEVEDYNNQISIGFVPLDIKTHEVMYGFGSVQLGTGYTQDLKGDIFYLDVQDEDSLLRLTNSPSTDEKAVRIETIPFILN